MPAFPESGANTDRRDDGRPVPLPSYIPVAVILLGDTLLLQAITLVATYIRLHLLPMGHTELSAGNIVGIHYAVMTIPIGFALAGLYPGYGLHAVDRLKRRVCVIALGFAGMSAFDYLAQNGLWSRGILLITFAFALLLPIWDMLAVSMLVRMRCWGIAVALFGPASERAAFSELLGSNPELGWYEAEAHDWPPDNGPASRGISVAVALPPPDLQPDANFDTLAYRHILLAPRLGPLQSHNVAARDVGPGRLILEMQRTLVLRRHAFTKRLIDICVAALLLLLAWPLILLAALAVCLLSPGWPFYVQLRRGKGGQPIQMWKIRTMVPNAEKLHPAVNGAAGTDAENWAVTGKLRADPRIIPGIGHWLRRFSIDELPQLWNVLRGDMSLVGPRPLPDYHLAILSPASIAVRELVRPGITGFWQVTKRATASQLEIESQDIYYVRNWSLWLDLYIFLRTVGVVLAGRGAS